jgi:hypothetical protein
MEDGSLILQFYHPLESKKLKIYTIISDRYVEFDCESVGEAGDYPPCSYIIHVLKCSLAMVKREHPRVLFGDRKPDVNNFILLKTPETEKDFAKSLSVKMIVDEFASKLVKYDSRKVYYKGDKDAPPDVNYVMETGGALLIDDIARAEQVIREKIKDHDAAADVKMRLNKLIGTYTSLLVSPLNYTPIVGDTFNLGYIDLMTKERRIEASEIDDLIVFAEDLSERVRNGNCVIHEAKGKVIDVSAGGVQIELSNEDLVKKISSQNTAMFDMHFQENNPLRVSGKIVWIKRLDGAYRLGVDFKGSRFGERFSRVIENHLKHFSRS